MKPKDEMVTVYDIGPLTTNMINLFRNDPEIEVLRVEGDRLIYRYVSEQSENQSGEKRG